MNHAGLQSPLTWTETNDPIGCSASSLAPPPGGRPWRHQVACGRQGTRRRARLIPQESAPSVTGTGPTELDSVRPGVRCQPESSHQGRSRVREEEGTLTMVKGVQLGVDSFEGPRFTSGSATGFCVMSIVHRWFLRKQEIPTTNPSVVQRQQEKIIQNKKLKSWSKS